MPLREQQRLLDQQRLDEEIARPAICPFNECVLNIYFAY